VRGRHCGGAAATVRDIGTRAGGGTGIVMVFVAARIA